MSLIRFHLCIMLIIFSLRKTGVQISNKIRSSSRTLVKVGDICLFDWMWNAIHLLWQRPTVYLIEVLDKQFVWKKIHLREESSPLEFVHPFSMFWYRFDMNILQSSLVVSKEHQDQMIFHRRLENGYDLVLTHIVSNHFAWQHKIEYDDHLSHSIEIIRAIFNFQDDRLTDRFKELIWERRRDLNHGNVTLVSLFVIESIVGVSNSSLAVVYFQVQIPMQGTSRPCLRFL